MCLLPVLILLAILVSQWKVWVFWALVVLIILASQYNDGEMDNGVDR